MPSVPTVLSGCAQPTQDERITSLQGQVNHLRCELSRLEETHYFGSERLRRDRWHATYNAVLGGLCSNHGDRMGFIDDASEMMASLEALAVECANERHGELEPSK